MSVEKLSSRDELRVSDSVECPERLLVSTFLHEPTGTFWTEPDQKEKRHGWGERRRQLEAPCQSTDVHKDQVAAESHQNSEGYKKLETRDKSTSNRCW